MMEKIIQITTGKGPEECCWVAAQVLKTLLLDAAAEGIDIQVLHREPGAQNGSVNAAILLVNGGEIDSFLADWVGTIQWIGKSSLRKMCRRRNWFIGVFEMAMPAMQAILDRDISYQAMRSSGAGGQHVNKVSSAIRATHLPTGLSTTAMDSRSQHQNKKLATARLREKFRLLQLDKLKQLATLQWENQQLVTRGNAIRTYEGTDFKKKPPPKAARQQSKQQPNSLTTGWHNN